MKQHRLVAFFIFCMMVSLSYGQSSWVRINQLGYLPKDIKVAVLISTEEITPDLSFRSRSGQPPVLPTNQHGTPNFSLIDAKTGKIIYSGQDVYKRQKPGTPFILVTHYPLQDGDVDNWYEITDLARKYNLKAVLAGHYHRNLLFSYDGIPGILNRSNLRDKSDGLGLSLIHI